MKRLLLLLCAVCTLSVAQAQMPDGSVVPNFTTTDLNGNTIELYDLLDQGYTVAIDVFATWCGPCWNYHNTGALKDYWNQYGPDGTGEVYVIGIEGDPTTTIDEIYGIGASTWGDWTEGVPYPIADASDVADLLQISYYPTIYFICQNRIIREAGQIGATQMYGLNDDCEQPAGANNAAILAYQGFEGTICGEATFAPSVTMQNLGTEVMTAATIEVSVGGAVVETVNWTGNLETFQTTDVNFSMVTVGQGDDLSINVTAVNNSTDEDLSNNLWNAEVSAPVLETVNATLEVKTDQYGYETYWAVLDETNEIIAEGGNTQVGLNGGGQQAVNSGGYGNNTTNVEEVSLPANGCYKLVVVDDWGDGICCAYGAGYYKLFDENGVEILTGGEFEASVEENFEEKGIVDNVTTVQTLSEINVFPNPTQNIATITMTLVEATDLVVELVDVTGKVVQSLDKGTLTAGNYVLPLDMSQVPAGMYNVVVKSGNAVTVERVVKQ